MTTEDINKYWPMATPAQKISIQIMYDSGWTLEPLDEDGFVPMHRATTYDTTEHARITGEGFVIMP